MFDDEAFVANLRSIIPGGPGGVMSDGQVQEFAKKFCEENKLKAIVEKELCQRLCSPAFFGQQQGKLFVGTEFAETAALRVLHQGSRVVGMLPIAVARDKLLVGAHAVANRADILPSLCQMLMQLTAGQLQSIASELLWSTVHPGEVLFVPMGMLVFESVAAGSVAWGVRCPCITTVQGPLLASVSILRDCFQDAKKSPEAWAALALAMRDSVSA